MFIDLEHIHDCEQVDNIAPHLKEASIEHGREHQCLRQTRQPELFTT